MNILNLIALLSLASLGAARPDPQQSTTSDGETSGSGTGADTGSGGTDAGSSVQGGELLSNTGCPRSHISTQPTSLPFPMPPSEYS